MRRLADCATAQGAPAVWRKPSLRQLKRKDSNTNKHHTGVPSTIEIKGNIANRTSTATRKPSVVICNIAIDVLRQVFRFLPQESLRACYDVCHTFQNSIEFDSFLNIEVKTQHLKDQCYDEVYNIGDIDLYGTDVDFCFQGPPETIICTESGWKVCFILITTKLMGELLNS